MASWGFSTYLGLQVYCSCRALLFTFYLWISLLYNERIDLREMINILGLYLISGIALYFTGILHELSEKVKHAAAAFKFVGLQAVLLLIFIQTFRFWVSKDKEIVPVIHVFLGNNLFVF